MTERGGEKTKKAMAAARALALSISVAVPLFVGAAVFAQTQPAAPSPEAAKEYVDGLSTAEKYRLYVDNHDLTELVAAFTGMAMVFAIIIFTILFLRRWKAPRMGYFLVTLTTLASRVMAPDVVFWSVVAFVAGLFSIFMFFSSKNAVNFDSKKEPLFYLFNAFSLLLIVYSADFYYATFSASSLSTSLFFVISRANTPHGKFKKHDADEMILKALEKRAGRER
jgi:hypothetical protein